MPVNVCNHISPTGLWCRAIAPSGQRLCRSHKSLESRNRRRLRYSKPTAIRLGPLNSPQAIVRAASRIVHAIGANTIHLSRANRMLRQLRTVSIEFNRPARVLPRPTLEPAGFALKPARLYNQPNPSSQPCRGNPSQPPTGKTK